MTEEERLTALLEITKTSRADVPGGAAVVYLKPINNTPLAREALNSQAASTMALRWAIERGINSPLLSDIPSPIGLDKNDEPVADPNQVVSMARQFKIARNMLA
jgi:hypothetical protein